MNPDADEAQPSDFVLHQNLPMVEHATAVTTWYSQRTNLRYVLFGINQGEDNGPWSLPDGARLFRWDEVNNLLGTTPVWLGPTHGVSDLTTIRDPVSREIFVFITNFENDVNFNNPSQLYWFDPLMEALILVDEVQTDGAYRSIAFTPFPGDQVGISVSLRLILIVC